MISKERIRIYAIFILSLLPATFFFSSVGVRAQNTENTVRVGWYESPFNTTYDSGRRSGYAYEYQLKLSAYSGWNYTYVDGSWTDLMQMLKDGDIDLMSDVSYTEERAKEMLLSMW